MKNKKSKGEYGYRDYHRTIQLCKVLFAVAMILVQLLFRSLTDNQAAKNVLTVMAILSVLPMANAASPLLASWKYRTPSAEFYNKVQRYESDFRILYDLILTSREFILPADAAVIHPLGIYIFTTSPNIKMSEIENQLNQLFQAQKLTPNIKIIGQEADFWHCLDHLKPSSDWEDDGSLEYGENYLKSLSM